MAAFEIPDWAMPLRLPTVFQEEIKKLDRMRRQNTSDGCYLETCIQEIFFNMDVQSSKTRPT